MTAKTTSDQLYQVFVRGIVFRLSKDQIEYDAPNFFTNRFDLAPNFDRYDAIVHLDFFNPIIFQIVIDYMCGDEIFPLPKILAGTKTQEVVFITLKKYASYLALEGLKNELDEAEKLIPRTIIMRCR